MRKYQEQGEAGFWCGTGNRHYSKDFKIKCVKSVLSGKGTVGEIVAKYTISDRSVLRSWIMKYNANMEGSFCSISKTAVTTAATAACIFSYFPGLLDKGRFTSGQSASVIGFTVKVCLSPEGRHLTHILLQCTKDSINTAQQAGGRGESWYTPHSSRSFPWPQSASH